MKRIALAIAVLAAGCPGKRTPDKVEAPPRAPTSAAERPIAETREPFREIEPGVFLFEQQVKRAGKPPMTVWLYSPTNPPKPGLGLVTVAPAGSPLITGMGLAEGDRPEHVPYVKAGYAVVSYELDGALTSADPGDEEIGLAMLAFMQSDAGLKNASTALDTALAVLPEPDMSRIYAAGHSSAATHALVLAATEDRIKAVAAYAAVTEFAPHFGDTLSDLKQALPGYDEFLERAEPMSHSDSLAGKPVLLFAAKDDPGHAEYNLKLLQAMGQAHPKTTNILVESGGHYESMIAEGIPAALAWFEELEDSESSGR